MSNIFLSLFTIIFSLFFLIQSISLPGSRSTGTLGPGAWPTALTALMLILGVWLLVSAILDIRKQKKLIELGINENLKDDSKGEEKLEGEELEGKIVFPLRYLLIFGVTFVYLILLSLMGFVVSTPLVIIALAIVLGMKKVLYILSTSIIGSAALIYIFILLLNVPLPRGIGFFRDLSILLY